MIIRVRTHAGIWRVNDLTPETTIAELRQRLSSEHNADLSDGTKQPLTLKPNIKGDMPGLPLSATLRSLGLGHGDMVHLYLDESMRDMAHEVRSLWIDCRLNALLLVAYRNERELLREGARLDCR